MKFNLPTKLTFLRLVLSLIIIILLLFPFYRFGIEFPSFLYHNILVDLRYIIAGILFVFASYTDYLDGKMARKNNQVTEFGKFIDAIADKVLVNSVLVIFAAHGFIPAIVPVIIVTRDIIVDAIRMTCANKGKVIAAKTSGKIKTAAMMSGVVLTFFYNLPFECFNLRVADFLIYFATIMSIVSMIEYFQVCKSIFVKKN